MLLTSSWKLDIAIFLGTIICSLYWYISRAQTYWQKKGVYTPKTIPIVGHFLNVAIFRRNLAEWLRDFYLITPERYFGLYVFNEPFFVLKDPTLINDVLIKNFDHFLDRSIAEPKHDDVQCNIMFFQKSPTWKNARVKLTPTFTTGRLKNMMNLIDQCGQEMVTFILKHQEVLEAKEIAAKYATNVISKCAFGIDSECFKHDKAIFREYGRKLFENSWRNGIFQSIYFLKASWVKTLKIDFIPKSCIEFFSAVFLDTVKKRTDKQRYNDLVDIIRDLRDSNEIAATFLDDANVAGIAIQFFLAGFETTSSTISFTLYEFSMNRMIQDKARNELFAIIDKFGKITYESLKETHYLDMCIYETLRKYPVLPFLDRRCNKDYKVPGTDLIIEKGTAVFIPMYGLQMDEKYFPDPFRYDPERFRNNKLNKNEIAFLPFGEGPRKCIGERFGRISTKLCLIHILKNFEIEKSQESPKRVTFDPKCFVLRSAVGLPIKFTQLNTQAT